MRDRSAITGQLNKHDRHLAHFRQPRLVTGHQAVRHRRRDIGQQPLPGFSCQRWQLARFCGDRFIYLGQLHKTTPQETAGTTPLHQIPNLWRKDNPARNGLVFGLTYLYQWRSRQQKFPTIKDPAQMNAVNIPGSNADLEA
jgi:hypothetical protein